MTNNGSYYWNDRILRVTRDATYELMVANLDIPELVEALQEADRCPNSKIRHGIWEFCIIIGVKEYKVVMGDDVVRDFDNGSCWTLIHIKPYSWA